MFDFALFATAGDRNCRLNWMYTIRTQHACKQHMLRESGRKATHLDERCIQQQELTWKCTDRCQPPPPSIKLGHFEQQPSSKPRVDHTVCFNIDWSSGLQPSASRSMFNSRGLALVVLTKGGRGGGGGRRRRRSEHLFGQAVTGLRHVTVTSVHWR